MLLSIASDAIEITNNEPRVVGLQMLHISPELSPSTNVICSTHHREEEIGFVGRRDLEMKQLAGLRDGGQSHPISIP